jgi:hypothetical protein
MLAFQPGGESYQVRQDRAIGQQRGELREHRNVDARAVLWRGARGPAKRGLSLRAGLAAGRRHILMFAGGAWKLGYSFAAWTSKPRRRKF